MVLLYDQTNDIIIKGNDCRTQLFTRKSRILENLPPTKAAPQQHVKHGTFQAICWIQALNSDPKLPRPEKWGWKKDSVIGWQPFWTKLPEASQSWYELIRCGCLKGCCGRCKCKKAELKCGCDSPRKVIDLQGHLLSRSIVANKTRVYITRAFQVQTNYNLANKDNLWWHKCGNFRCPYSMTSGGQQRSNSRWLHVWK